MFFSPEADTNYVVSGMVGNAPSRFLFLNHHHAGLCKAHDEVRAALQNTTIGFVF